MEGYIERYLAQVFTSPGIYCNLIVVTINTGYTATFIGRAKSRTTHCVNTSGADNRLCCIITTSDVYRSRSLEIKRDFAPGVQYNQKLILHSHYKRVSFLTVFPSNLFRGEFYYYHDESWIPFSKQTIIYNETFNS